MPIDRADPPMPFEQLAFNRERARVGQAATICRAPEFEVLMRVSSCTRCPTFRRRPGEDVPILQLGSPRSMYGFIRR